MGWPLYVAKRDNALVPISRAGQVALDQLAYGKTYKINPHRPRNEDQHRLWGAFATHVAMALNDGPTAVTWDVDKVNRHIKIANGYVDYIKLSPREAERLGVTHVADVRSISFKAMPQDDFATFFETALVYVRDHLAPWLVDSPQWPEIERIIAASWLEQGGDAA